MPPRRKPRRPLPRLLAVLAVTLFLSAAMLAVAYAIYIKVPRTATLDGSLDFSHFDTLTLAADQNAFESHIEELLRARTTRESALQLFYRARPDASPGFLRDATTPAPTLAWHRESDGEHARLTIHFDTHDIDADTARLSAWLESAYRIALVNTPGTAAQHDENRRLQIQVLKADLDELKFRVASAARQATELTEEARAAASTTVSEQQLAALRNNVDQSLATYTALIRQSVALETRERRIQEALNSPDAKPLLRALAASDEKLAAALAGDPTNPDGRGVPDTSAPSSTRPALAHLDAARPRLAEMATEVASAKTALESEISTAQNTMFSARKRFDDATALAGVADRKRSEAASAERRATDLKPSIDQATTQLAQLEQAVKSAPAPLPPRPVVVNNLHDPRGWYAAAAVGGIGLIASCVVGMIWRAQT